MAFSYDPATAPGQVRLLAVDTIEASAAFSDAEISSFLTLSGGVVLLASALALDRRAALVALIQAKTTVEGISVDGTVVAQVFHSQAAELRRQCFEAEDRTGASPSERLTSTMAI